MTDGDPCICGHAYYDHKHPELHNDFTFCNVCGRDDCGEFVEDENYDPTPWEAGEGGGGGTELAERQDRIQRELKR